MGKLTEIEKFRCTKDEKELLKSLAGEINISKSDYLRHLINNREKPIIGEKKNEEEKGAKDYLKDNYYSLGKIGVNLNQIAYYFNLEHLKALDDTDRKIEELTLLDKIKSNELISLRNGIEELNNSLSKLQDKIAEYFEG